MSEPAARRPPTGCCSAGHTTLAEIGTLAHDTRYWPSSLTTRIVLDLAHPKIESALESPESGTSCGLNTLPCPEPQVEVRNESGGLVARVDFVWLAAGVFLEADGREKYLQHRRPGESLDDYLMQGEAA